MLKVIGALGTWIVVLPIFVLVNGGYVYKTTCPGAAGSSTTSWTYAIDDILPYIRHTSAPCTSHTGTRLVLSAVGIDKITTATPTATRTTVADKRVLNELTRTTSDITAEFVRERAVMVAFKAKVKVQGFTAANRAEAYRFVREGEGRFKAIRLMLDGGAPATDSQLNRARTLLSEWLQYQVAADESLYDARSRAQVTASQKRISSEIAGVVSQLRPLATEIEARYPKVDQWTFIGA